MVAEWVGRVAALILLRSPVISRCKTSSPSGGQSISTFPPSGKIWQKLSDRSKAQARGCSGRAGACCTAKSRRTAGITRHRFLVVGHLVSFVLLLLLTPVANEDQGQEKSDGQQKTYGQTSFCATAHTV